MLGAYETDEDRVFPVPARKNVEESGRRLLISADLFILLY
jgi:hypothetical protein